MNAYILDAVRTPVGKFLGGLSSLTAPELAAPLLSALLNRSHLEPNQIDEVILGNVVQAGVGQNPARQAALKASLPDTVAAFTVNKVCGSGLKAVMLAAQAIRAGDADLIIAGGTESMSQAPYLLPKARTGFKYGHQQAIDALVHDGLWCPFENWAMGEAAEHIAQKCGVTREAQDAFAVESHRRAAAAWQSGAFDATEVVPLEIERDEGIRPATSMESLARLRPVFRADGGVTAGNASQLSDGAAAVVVASERAVERHGWTPMAKIEAYATSGIAPKDIFLAPVDSIRMVLEKAKLTLGEVDLFELNEAFAAQMLACQAELGLDSARVNVHGGGVALGHPIGASGARVLVTLLHAMRKRSAGTGLASLCLGGGNAVSMIVTR